MTDSLFRRLILGQLDQDEQQRTEELFLTDTRCRENVLAAEDDLIEDHLEDNLGAAESERFTVRFAQTPLQRRRLRIMKSIRDWAKKESKTRKEKVN